MFSGMTTRSDASFLEYNWITYRFSSWADVVGAKGWLDSACCLQTLCLRLTNWSEKDRKTLWSWQKSCWCLIRWDDWRPRKRFSIVTWTGKCGLIELEVYCWLGIGFKWIPVGVVNWFEDLDGRGITRLIRQGEGVKMKSQIEYAWAARNDNKIRLNACLYKLMKMRCQ